MLAHLTLKFSTEQGSSTSNATEDVEWQRDAWSINEENVKVCTSCVLGSENTTKVVKGHRILIDVVSAWKLFHERLSSSR